ncbi:MAG: dihydropteroate synthase [Actinomycetota bacterium]
MKLHGVVNASQDSLAEFSIALDTDSALKRARDLIDHGCVGIDLGAAGSTQYAERISTEEEWARLDGKIQAIAELGIELSVDTWNPEIMSRALEAGANFMNAADGLQNPAMVEIAVQSGVPVVLPFLSGDDPKSLQFVSGDPVAHILDWFEMVLNRLGKSGIREDQLILDPGTGFGPANWEWKDRYAYQEQVYSNLEKLRVFELPIYIALPWKMDEGRQHLLEILLQVGFDYGRTHIPQQVLEIKKALD